MRYDYHTYNRYMRRIKPENDIRIDELKKVISIIKCRLDYQRTKEMYAAIYGDSADVEEAKIWNHGFNCAHETLMMLLEACILDYEGKL